MAFFLGGQDLEMQAILALLRGRVAAGDSTVRQVHDKGLGWGAAASAYDGLIAAAAAQDLVPVLVELEPDVPLPPTTRLIDHHGARSAEPCALRQVFDLLGLPQDEWSAEMALVAANDVGHVAGMRAIGATEDDIRRIRAADRSAQGITPQEEMAGLRALETARVAMGGGLLIVTLPHGRAATVTDPLAVRGDPRDLLLLTPDSREFYGRGTAITQLDAAFPGGWRGGASPERGFWGRHGAVPEELLLAALSA